MHAQEAINGTLWMEVSKAIVHLSQPVRNSCPVLRIDTCLETLRLYEFQQENSLMLEVDPIGWTTWRHF